MIPTNLGELGELLSENGDGQMQSGNEDKDAVDGNKRESKKRREEKRDHHIGSERRAKDGWKRGT